MTLDPYAVCPCGSGKKFKWCCQAIHGGIEKAFKQHEDGQHEAALRTMDEIVAANSSNPEVYGRKAVLLYNLGRTGEAEQTLEKALQVNPKYPFGYYLRANVRAAQGKIGEALALFRKAADLYDPSAKEILASVYAKITEMEMHLQRPIAARAALMQAIGLNPHAEGYREALEGMFGKEAGLPETAKGEHKYLGLADAAPPQVKKAWQEALSGQTTGRLADAAAAFEKISEDDPDNAAAWYNLGLTRAWLGDNAGALAAMEEYVRRESDEGRSAAAWTLAEVLRFGHDVPEEERDYTEYSRIYEMTNGPQASEVLNNFSKQGRMLATNVDEENHTFSGLLLQAPTVLTAGAATPETPRFAANLLIVGINLRVWSTNRDSLEKIAREIEEQAGDALYLRVKESGPANISDIFSEALIFPVAKTEAEHQQSLKQIEEAVAGFFEQTWIHRPLHSLGGVPPIDAPGSFSLKKKLVGVVRFLEEVAAALKYPYDFNRLRHKLGLLESAPQTSRESRDFAAMNAADLSGLDAAELSDEELERAAGAAAKLDAGEVHASFLQELVKRPVSMEKPDRFPQYRQLIEHALKGHKPADAMNFVDAGEKADCEYNQGRRRNDYELWRAKVQTKCGEVADAREIFGRLIERVPAELSYRGAAAEAMLSAKEYQEALQFAKGGLEQARKQQDRDSEEYFLELTAAAERG